MNNKIQFYNGALQRLEKQRELLSKAVENYILLVQGQTISYNLGDGTLVNLNYQESKMIETQLKLIGVQQKFFNYFNQLLYFSVRKQ